MGREIKFRAWDAINKHMIPHNLLGIGLKNINNTEYGKKQFTYMQFTGKQLNGVDLYEGDVIRLEESAEGVDPSDEMAYYIVTWISEWCMFVALHRENEYFQHLKNGVVELDEMLFWTFPLDPIDTETSKHFLCGNIYEHPNLLK